MQMFLYSEYFQWLKSVDAEGMKGWPYIVEVDVIYYV
jgi:hypothetical protein